MNLYELQSFLGIEEAEQPPLKVVLHSTSSSVSKPLVSKPLVSKIVTRKAVKTPSTKVSLVRDGVNPVVKKKLYEKIKELELAQKLGYFLCKCTWPPQIMVMTTSDFIYECPSCSRIRDVWGGIISWPTVVTAVRRQRILCHILWHAASSWMLLPCRVGYYPLYWRHG